MPDETDEHMAKSFAVVGRLVEKAKHWMGREEEPAVKRLVASLYLKKAAECLVTMACALDSVGGQDFNVDITEQK